MMESIAGRLADPSTLKRSLADFRDDGGVSGNESTHSTTHLDHTRLLAALPSPRRMSFTSTEARWPPVDTLPRRRESVPESLSSLTAVLDARPAMSASAEPTSVQGPGQVEALQSTHVHSSDIHLPSAAHLDARRQAHGSISTSGSGSSDSTDSSPTTTVSTVDSPSVTDSSPGTSPETPPPVIPLLGPSRSKSVPLPLHLVAEAAPTTTTTLSPPPPPRSPLVGPNGPVSPARKPRNTKNLSLNMAAPTRPLPPPALRIKTASAANDLQSAPPSPSSINPPRPPRKRPSNLGLTVRTPAFPTAAVASRSGLGGGPSSPSSPARPNTLRHHQSSPALTVFSPTMGIEGGMQLPSFAAAPRHVGPGPGPLPPLLPLPRPSRYPRSRPGSADSAGACFSGPTSPIGPADQTCGAPQELSLHKLEEEEEDDYDVPLSQEVKSPAYPSGPVCIYDPHVYLYLEPSHEEAAQFDVILNVAREVKNPFGMLVDDEVAPTSQELLGVTSPSLEPPRRSPLPHASFLMSGPVRAASPDSLDSSSSSNRRAPEYIHIPWDHNSNIVDDMLHLVEVIDERVRRGKRVLVHCQCGVSRSASLIVAYGLYRDPSLTVQEVYDAVKRKSRWIGPNMSLIYQLSEFRNKMIQRRGLATSGLRGWRGAGLKASASGTGRANTLPSDGRDVPLFAVGPFEARRSAPQTAPLPGEGDRERGSGRSSPSTSGLEGSLRPVHTEGHRDVAPGPSSAPSGVSWDTPPSPHQMPPPPPPPPPAPPALHILPASTFSTTTHHHGAMPPPTRPPPAVPCRPGLGSRSLTASYSSSSSLPLRGLSAPLPPPRPRTTDDILSTITTRHVLARGETVDDEVPPTPTLMSPRASTFTANPLHEFRPTTRLGLHTGIPVDPRSPPQRGEAPIVRSIFDVL
ncbi:MAG: hypothetical protein M1823_003178 [Watsoniomyces obsoletus]|nr:MAG: hypothetical protein M1823_003178 [Watsoniomyces obsoletus]